MGLSHLHVPLLVIYHSNLMIHSSPFVFGWIPQNSLLGLHHWSAFARSAMVQEVVHHHLEAQLEMGNK